MKSKLRKNFETKQYTNNILNLKSSAADNPYAVWVLPTFSSCACHPRLLQSHRKALRIKRAPCLLHLLQLFPPPGILSPTSSQMCHLLTFQMQTPSLTTQSRINAKPIPLTPQHPSLPETIFLYLLPGFPFTLKCQLCEKRVMPCSWLFLQSLDKGQAHSYPSIIIS